MSRYIIITICFLLTLVVGFFALYPKYQELTLLNNQISGKKEELQFREEYLNELSKASDKLGTYENTLKIISATLPSGSSLPLLFDFFQKAGSQSGLILKDVSAVEGSSLGNAKVINISLQATGSYSSFKDFIVILEKSARLINIDSFSFGLSKQGESAVFNFNLAANAYSY
jgi:Tfp pilus assembly protein PilO